MRLMSAFRDKFTVPDKYPTAGHVIKWILTHLRHGQEQRSSEDKGTSVHVSFGEFIQFLVTSASPAVRDKHWETYRHLCSPCTVDYDFIGHLETFHEDAIMLLKHELKVDPWYAPKSSAATNTTSLGTREAFSQLPLNLLEMVKERYDDDAAMFGYDLEKY